MALGRRNLRSKVGDSLSEIANNAYEDVEGITVSLGVIFALLLPTAMGLQYLAHDDKVQERNFFLLLCTEPNFRGFVIETLEDPNTGNIGVYEKEMFNFTVRLGRGQTLDMKQILQDNSKWVAEPSSPEDIYECAEGSKEAVTTAHLLLEHFPMRMMGAWALMNKDSMLWSDHLHAMAAFAMALLKAGLLGSLFLYISLSASPGRETQKEGATSSAVQAWGVVGIPTIAFNFVCLCAAIICLLLGQDAYVESQDTFAFRSGRLGGYSKIAMLAVFLPLAIIFAWGAIWSLVRSCRSNRVLPLEDKSCHPTRVLPVEERA